MIPSLQLTSVSLRVADLTCSVDFYQRKLGFAVVGHAGNRVDLATGPACPAVLHLEEAREARRAPHDAAGLFHIALLFPDTPLLGAWLQFAASHGVDFDGFSDHGVSEAIYFSDPDGNGLEFYVDRPRAKWPVRDGEIAMFTRPLALQKLLGSASAVTATPLDGATWGHLHLRVTNLDRSEAFYRELLGVEVTQRSYPGARFLAADGYHHHLGLNTWGHPRIPCPPGALGLVEATFSSAAETAEFRTRDPDGIGLRVEPQVFAPVKA
jgi:catechol 2,3-dioxygenase